MTLTENPNWNLALDLKGIRPWGGFVRLDEGEYSVLISGVTEVPKKSGEGTNLVANVVVSPGEPHAGTAKKIYIARPSSASDDKQNAIFKAKIAALLTSSGYALDSFQGTVMVQPGLFNGKTAFIRVRHEDSSYKDATTGEDRTGISEQFSFITQAEYLKVRSAVSTAVASPSGLGVASMAGNGITPTLVGPAPNMSITAGSPSPALSALFQSNRS